jgi:hypothetical protein
MSQTQTTPLEFLDPVQSKALTKKVLWKLDTHVLPALALVSILALSISSPLDLTNGPIVVAR